ncbi:MAG: APC family permease [Gemmatimonadales bacterium]
MAVLAPEAPTATPALPRVVGTRGFALTVINTVVGAGVFGIPALMAAELGRNALLALVACGLVVFCIALCFAEAGTRVPDAGGYYAIAARAFGPFAGSLTGSLGWIANGAVGNAAVGALLVALLKNYVPALGRPGVQFVAIAFTYAALAVLTIRSTRVAVAVSSILGVAKLVPLVLLGLALPFVVRAEALPALPLPSGSAFGHGMILMFFAFLGSEAALGICGECRQPSRTIPRGLIASIGFIALLYGALQITTASVLGPALVAAGENALPLAATAILGTWAGRLVAIAAAMAMLSCLVADVTCSPRVLFAMGRDGLLPRRLGAVHPTLGTPWVAVAFYALLCGALVAGGTFRQLAVLGSAGTLLLDLVVAIAVLRLRAKGVRGHDAPFVVPGGPLVPLLVAGFTAIMLGTLTSVELMSTGMLVVAAAGGYLLSRLGGVERLR